MRIESSPAIGADGTIYFGSDDRHFYAIGPGTHAPAKLAFQTQPSNTDAGSTITPAVTVQVLDANGNLVKTANNAVTMALGVNPGNSTLGGSLIQYAINGVATFANLTLNTAGNGYTLTASATRLTSATSNTFSIIGPTITSFIPTNGGTGTVVTITGTNFTGATAVTFGGMDAASFTVASDTSITATVGSGASGIITVSTPGGTANSGASFTVNPPLTAVNVTVAPTSPQIVNTPITFTAMATGGTNVSYQFWLYNANANPAWSRLQAYSTKATCAWTPATDGNFMLSVTAQDGMTGTAVNTMLGYTIYSPLIGVSVAASKPSPQPPNTSITLTATAMGGTSVQFQYWLYNQAANPAWSQLQGYSSSASCQWAPAETGNYAIAVTALDATGTAVNTLLSYTICYPLTAVSVTSSLASPQLTGTPITFTAEATGGASVQFQYWLYNPLASPAWSLLQGFLSSATYQWIPAAPGNCVLSVTAQDATGVAVNTLVPYTICNPLTAVSVTSSLASPQPPNTAITLTATAIGGTNVQFQYWLYNQAAYPAWSQLQGFFVVGKLSVDTGINGKLCDCRDRIGRHRHCSQYVTAVYHLLPADGR